MKHINNYSGDDVIYYNITMTGSPNAAQSIAQFYEERTQPIINNPSDYYLSVIRFSIDGSYIPIFICPVIANPLDVNDINYTPFTVTLSAEGNDFTQNIRYFPESSGYPLPLSPGVTGKQDISSSYYYVYTYTRFVEMINNAIQVAFNNLIAAHPAYAITQAPYYIFDPDEKIISLIVRNDVLGGSNIWLTPKVPQANPSNPSTPPINQLAGQPVQPQPSNTIYMYENEYLFAYVDGIDSFGYYQIPDKALLLIFSDQKNNYYYPPQNSPNVPATQTPTSFTDIATNYTTAPEWFIFTQQFQVLQNWNSLESIVFTTTHLPVQVEYIPSSSIITPNGVSGANFKPILTDFVPLLEEVGSTSSRFVYNPSGKYRLIDLKSQIPLRKIDLQIFWQDQFQNLYPLRISYNQSNSVKLMFIKKSMENNDF